MQFVKKKRKKNYNIYKKKDIHTYKIIKNIYKTTNI